MGLIDLLKLPQKCSVEDLDDPSTTMLHGEILKQKAFMRKLYVDFYRQFSRAVGTVEGKTLVELGSGAGFIKEVLGDVITSDILELPCVDKVFSALEMPFDTGAVDAFFMIDVLHHIADPRAFFTEALRCLKDGGKIVMIEPANTLWSRFIFKNFHHEGFDPNAGWELQGEGPMSEANGAIPWIIFHRDREIFEKEFPQLRLLRKVNHTPMRYLVSGGFTLRQLLPGFCYPLILASEFILSPMSCMLGMFQTIELEKVGKV